jgi:hypothetical protein
MVGLVDIKFLPNLETNILLFTCVTKERLRLPSEANPFNNLSNTTVICPIKAIDSFEIICPADWGIDLHSC